MSHEFIYNVEADGALRRMEPSAPENEARMQALIARYPELIADEDGELLLIRREQRISDNGEGGGRWSVDHLFVTREGVPVLVEVKRAVDTRLRREVVGQMLDYAANATAYWQAGRVAQSFAATASDLEADPDAALAGFIGDTDPDSFWRQVDANFTAGRLKLVFVADEIPRELARIVEFLNDRMRAEVRAVELRWFAGEGGSVTLSPKIIGQTERAALQKRVTAALPPISTIEWIEKYLAPRGQEVAAGATEFLKLMDRLGANSAVSLQRGSLLGWYGLEDGRSIYAYRLTTAGTVHVTFQYLKSRGRLGDPNVRHAYAARIKASAGDTKVSAAQLTEPRVLEALEGIFHDIGRDILASQTPGTLAQG